jgi:proliferating cell nuclear antigen
LTFSVSTDSPDEWKVVTSAISTIVDEATFEANVEGLLFRGMDPSHVALIDIHWPNSAFQKFYCNDSIKFGVRIDEFSKLIRRADKKDKVEVSIGENSTLVIRIENGYSREYRMRLIESSSGSTPLPKLNFNSRVVLNSSTLDRVFSDIQVVSEYVTLGSDKAKIVFTGKGDSGEASITLDQTSEGLEDIAVKENSSATYSLDYLSRMIKAVGSSGGSVTAEYSTKMPLRLEFRVANIGRIHFYLAPRVQD